MSKVPRTGRRRDGLQPTIILFSAACVVAALYVGGAPLRPHATVEHWEAAFEPIPLPESSAANRAVASRPHTAATLREIFRRLGYDLDAVREHGQVPRVFLAALPPDMPDVPNPDARKLVFLKTILPLVLHVNEVIANDRARILELSQTYRSTNRLSPTDAQWLRTMAKSYQLDEDADFDELLLRVDAIPPSLALAQAALESGWGTSRVAQTGNALFGQYTMFGQGPAQSEEAKNYRIKYFDSLVDAVKAYATNLNTHAAYEDFRKLRAKMRGANFEPDGYDLADTLTSYSELRMEYVKSVKRLIDINALSRFDDARLSHRLALRL